MTITRILALLSVVALLASLPVTVALGQGGEGSDAPPIPPFTVVGNATIDGEPAMDGTNGRRHDRRREGRHRPR